MAERTSFSRSRGARVFFFLIGVWAVAQLGLEFLNSYRLFEFGEYIDVEIVKEYRNRSPNPDCGSGGDRRYPPRERNARPLRPRRLCDRSLGAGRTGYDAVSKISDRCCPFQCDHVWPLVLGEGYSNRLSTYIDALVLA